MCLFCNRLANLETSIRSSNQDSLFNNSLSITPSELNLPISRRARRSNRSSNRRIPDPGNTLKEAYNLGNLRSSLSANDAFQRFRNSIGGRNDQSDYYQFTLRRPSNFSLQLDRLKTNANVEVFRLNRKGERTRNPRPKGNFIQRVISNLTISHQGGVRRSTTSGTQTESLNLFRLPPGKYAIRTYTKSKTRTNYNLSLFASPSATGDFNIKFDYRFDTDGFFNNPIRRATLEAAAYIWESWIAEDFPDISPGVSFTVRNPRTGGRTGITLTDPIDDLLIFVGTQATQKLPNADAGPDGFDAVGTIFHNRVTQSDFTPWAGTIRFEQNPQFSDRTLTQWFFDSTPSTSSDRPSATINFLGTAMHEIGHVLGFGTSKSFQDKLNPASMQFIGLNARKVNRNNPIPFRIESGHMQDNFLLDQQFPTMSNSGRYSNYPTRADLAVLADIGYKIPGFTHQGSSLRLATEGKDAIFGTVGTDIINALGGDDFINGNAGDDTLDGGSGNDLLEGGLGRDKFFFTSGSGIDSIINFITTEDTVLVPATVGYRIIRRSNTTTNGLFSEVAIGNRGDKVTIFHNIPLTAANFILA